MYFKLKNGCPEDKASFLSRITFWWFNSIVWIGYKRPLVTDDLWSLTYQNMTSSIIKIFDKIWIPSIEKEKENALQKTREGEPVITQVNLTMALLKTYWPGFMFCGILKLIASALTFVNPMVLDMLINFMDPNSTDPEWRGYFYALLMFVSPMFESLFNSQYEYRINLISMKIRACVISVIYRKVTSTLSTFLLFLL